MSEKHLTCIGCPVGCQLTVTMNGRDVTEVSGNNCKRGAVYGAKEVTNPTRIVTTTVRVTGGEIGAGDGLLIIAMGSVMTAGELIGILFAALLLCGIYSGIQLLVLKKQRDIEIPFVPFLLAGYLGGVFL